MLPQLKHLLPIIEQYHHRLSIFIQCSVHYEADDAQPVPPAINIQSSVHFEADDAEPVPGVINIKSSVHFEADDVEPVAPVLTDEAKQLLLLALRLRRLELVGVHRLSTVVSWRHSAAL